MHLATLLRDDEERYVAEFKQMEKTPEERMESIKQKAMALQERRTEDDNRKATTIMAKKFGDEDDEIRTIRSQQERLQIAADQLLQINQRRKEKDYERDKQRLWDDIWMDDYNKKLEEENRRIAHGVELKREQTAMLDQQRVELQRRREYDARLRAEEAELGREQKELYDREQQEEKEEKERAKREMFGEYKRFNKLIERKKLAEEAKRRADEIEFIEDILAKEKRDMEKEDAVKRRARQEIMDQRQQALDDLRARQADEQELERLIAEEGERVYQKQKAVWDREAEARRRLLHEVIDDRKRLIQEKRDNKIREIEDNYEEGRRIYERVKQEEALEQEKMRQRKEHERQIGRDRAVQIAEKREYENKANVKEQALLDADKRYNQIREMSVQKQMAEGVKRREALSDYVYDLYTETENKLQAAPLHRQMHVRQFQKDQAATLQRDQEREKEILEKRSPPRFKGFYHKKSTPW